MAKQTSARKVARAARTGGGRTSRGRSSLAWYVTLTAIVVAGVVLTAVSWQERQDTLTGPATGEAPTTKDHWHVALGVYVCDKFLPPVQNQNDPKGIHTHGDGVIHVHPFGASGAGRNATFGLFVEAIDAKLSDTAFDWPGEPERSNNEKCGDKAGKVKAWFNGALQEGNPRNIRLSADRAELILAFVPDDVTLETIGKPPSVPNLDQLTDVPAAPNPNPAPQENAATSSTTPPPPPPPAPSVAPGDTTAPAPSTP